MKVWKSLYLQLVCNCRKKSNFLSATHAELVNCTIKIYFLFCYYECTNAS